MATIRKLPSGRYQAQIRKAGKPNINSTHDTKEQAVAWVEEQEGIIKRDSLSVYDLANLYLSEVMTVNGKQRGGYEAIYYKLRTLCDFLSVRPLESLTSADVATYRNARLEAVASGTVRLEIQLLSRFLRWLEAEKGINCTDVTKKVKLPEAGKARDRVITPLEYEMILCRASERAQPAIILAYETAMRRNEILAITPRMIDFTKRIITLSSDQTKNGEARAVPLSTVAVALLRELCEGKEKDSRLITLTPYALTQAFRRAAKLSGVTGVCFHSLRHTCVTRYAEKGLSTVQLQSISGHKSLAMLQRYTHIKAESIVNLLD